VIALGGDPLVRGFIELTFVSLAQERIGRRRLTARQKKKKKAA